MTKVKITSDGTHPGTVVRVNGERIENVADVRWSIRPGGLAEVTLKLINVELEVDGQVAMKFEGPPKIPTALELLQQIAPVEYERIAKLVGSSNMSEAIGGMAEGIRENLARLEDLCR